MAHRIKDPRYDYHITVSAQIIVVDKDKILLQKRPSTWEWAPGRWCLPGGKLYNHESFEELIKRKTKQELGFELTPEKIFSIKQLIMEEKQAFMFFYPATYKGQKFKGEMEEYRWFSKNQLKDIPSQEMAEYFYKNLLISYLENPNQTTSVETFNYVEMQKEKIYQKWHKGIINENYNPEKVADFQKWKNSNRRSSK